MKKEYVSPRVDIIYTRLESELLAGSDGNIGFPGETDNKAKTYDFGLDDFSDEPLWNDEMDGNN